MPCLSHRCAAMSGRVHGVSLYFGPVPLVLWPTKLNFGLLFKNRPKSPPEHGTSLDFAGFRVDLADFAAVGPYNAGHAMFEPSVCSNEWQGPWCVTVLWSSTRCTFSPLQLNFGLSKRRPRRFVRTSNVIRFRWLSSCRFRGRRPV
jgi:hypothetical protein